ncbi:MAG: CE1759 family FMN reductase [Bifidobacterium psychraerophilum]|uniref:CE1759 family FMN reductase n=1 Tax=Bifidobacterium psychraerophilum TaxID=218140 RepID=UPI0039E97779
MNHAETNRCHITVVSAGVGEPSTTTKLAEGIAERTVVRLRDQGIAAQVNVIELKNLAQDISTAAVSWKITPQLQSALDIVSQSDALVAASPVFKASYSGLFKSFWDIAQQDAVLGMPVAVVATGGSERHALVPDTSMRSLFAFLRAVIAPTGVMAATVDWGSPGLVDRQTRVAGELASLVQADIRRTLLAAVGEHYSSSEDGLASQPVSDDTHADGEVDDVSQDFDFDSSLMRLAAGGR